MSDQITIPALLAEYIKIQNAQDSAAFAELFTADARVHDEGKDYTGKAAIKEWIEDANEKYQTIVEAVACAVKGAETVLTLKMSGTFPGSPLNADFHFEIVDNKISHLYVT